MSRGVNLSEEERETLTKVVKEHFGSREAFAEAIEHTVTRSRGGDYDSYAEKGDSTMRRILDTQNKIGSRLAGLVWDTIAHSRGRHVHMPDNRIRFIFDIHNGNYSRQEDLGITAGTQDFGDPLRFIQETARSLDLKLRFKYDRDDSFGYENSGSSFCIGWGTRRKRPNNDTHSLSLFLNRYPEKAIGDAEEFSRFLDGETKIDGKSYADFSFNRDSFRFFGSHSNDLSLSVLYIRDHNEDEMNVGMEIEQPSSGSFRLSRINYTYSLNEDEFPNERDFSRKQIRAKELEQFTQDRDFRPYMHRLLEVYANIPRNEWHDPRMYVNGNTNNQQLEQVVDSAIDMLFIGDERERIERQVAEARLNMRRNWQSVPRLNLGPIQLPNPGMKNIDQDKFVTEATPYVVEYLHQLGVMSRDEAEQVAARKLTNYFIHQAGFQLSRDRASQIVDGLRQRETSYVKGVA